MNLKTFKRQAYLPPKIRPRKRPGDAVATNLKAIKYTSDGKIQVKLDFDDDYIDLPQRMKNKSQKLSSFPHLHKERLKISKTKWNHLQELKAVIPMDCHPYDASYGRQQRGDGRTKMRARIVLSGMLILKLHKRHYNTGIVCKKNWSDAWINVARLVIYIHKKKQRSKNGALQDTIFPLRIQVTKLAGPKRTTLHIQAGRGEIGATPHLFRIAYPAESRRNFDLHPIISYSVSKLKMEYRIPVEIGIAFAAISPALITMVHVSGHQEEFRRIVLLHCAENPLAMNFASFAILVFAQFRLVDLDHFARPANAFSVHQHPVYAHLGAETRPGDDHLSRSQKFVHYSLLSRVFDQAPERECVIMWIGSMFECKFTRVGASLLITEHGELLTSAGTTDRPKWLHLLYHSKYMSSSSMVKRNPWTLGVEVMQEYRASANIVAIHPQIALTPHDMKLVLDRYNEEFYEIFRVGRQLRESTMVQGSCGRRPVACPPLYSPSRSTAAVDLASLNPVQCLV
ncbi:hypothetical protein PR048_018133 [Dryococelus australis]|uniref:Uncharacterized protein n=1 Tax=Dryococelus australis TaxID=614101 RepID=A0ABQ9HBJ1_9NEOP|nr:hypothetical protein PR048_018133 [Dryococelus australis]